MENELYTLLLECCKKRPHDLEHNYSYGYKSKTLNSESRKKINDFLKNDKEVFENKIKNFLKEKESLFLTEDLRKKGYVEGQIFSESKTADVESDVFEYFTFSEFPPLYIVKSRFSIGTSLATYEEHIKQIGVKGLFLRKKKYPSTPVQQFDELKKEFENSFENYTFNSCEKRFISIKGEETYFLSFGELCTSISRAEYDNAMKIREESKEEVCRKKLQERIKELKGE